MSSMKTSGDAFFCEYASLLFAMPCFAPVHLFEISWHLDQMDSCHVRDLSCIADASPVVSISTLGRVILAVSSLFSALIRHPAH